MYHVLEQPIEDNEYEELDKFTKKKGRNQQEEEEGTCYTTEGPADEREGPGGGASINDSISEEYDKSMLITKNGN